MAEYIDREVAKGSLRMNQHRFTCADEANGFGSVKWSEDVIYAGAAQKAIDSIPSADVVEVRHGEWIETIEHNGWVDETCAECSECGEDFILGEMDMDDIRNLFLYCPNCGAYMRKAGE